MASEKKYIVTAFVIPDSDECQIDVEDKPNMDKIISVAGCLKNPEKTSIFLQNLTSLIQPTEIKAFLMTFPLTYPIKIVQAVKQKIKEFCEKNEIFCSFPPHLGLSHLGMLYSARPVINDGENVILISVAVFMVHCQVYKRVQEEYVSIDGFKSVVLPDFPLAAIKQQIVKNFKPKKIILINVGNNENENDAMRMFKIGNQFARILQALSKFDCMVLEEDFVCSVLSCGKILFGHLMGEEVAEYMVRFFCDRDIKVSSLIKCDGRDYLPLEKSVVYKVKKDDSIKLTENDHGVIQSIDLSEYAFRQVKITLKIDENMFYDLQVHPIGPAKKLTVAKPEEKPKESGPKAKLVFTQNDYMIFAWKNGKKKIIKDFAGSTKIPFSISFAKEIPAMGESAMKDLIEKPQFVVYDLLKLCQTDILENIDPKWPFKIIQDCETRENLIQFETFRGPRKASADFLLSLILKNSMVLIERETGVKVEEFGIEVSGIDGSESIKRCLEKAAERIKLKITFL